MEAAAAHTLSQFASFIKDKAPCAENVATLAQKWLAMNVTSVHVESVYPYVAPDYKLVALRIGTFISAEEKIVLPPLDQSAAMDPQAFVYIVKNSLMSDATDAVPPMPQSFTRFCDTLFPVPVGQEQWVTVTERAKDWKRKAYFLALHCGGGVRDKSRRSSDARGDF